MASTYNYEYFNVTFPGEYVAQVEINRPEKMNAFNETYVRSSFWPFNSMHCTSHLSSLAITIQLQVFTADNNPETNKD